MISDLLSATNREPSQTSISLMAEVTPSASDAEQILLPSETDTMDLG